MADVEANVEITVEGAGELRDAAAEAEALAEALHEDRDAAAELGASGADVEGLSAELGHARDNALEAAAAQDALGHKLAGSTSAIAQMGDELGRFTSAGNFADELGLSSDELQRKLPQIAAIGEDVQARMKSASDDIDKMGSSGGGASAFEALEREMGTYRSETEKAADSTARLEQGIRSTGLAGAESGIAGGSGLEKYAADLEKARGVIAAAEPQVSAMDSALGESGEKAGIAATALGNWHAAWSDVASGGDLGTATTATHELGGALDDMRRSGDDAARALGDLAGGGSGGGGSLLSDLAGDGKKAVSVIGQLGSGLKDAWGVGTSALMPAAITGLVSAVSTIGPVLLSAGAGFGSFAALAAPALEKVKTGYTAVTTAQAAYKQAVGVEKADPTSTNLKAQQTALAQLRATYATMPAPIRQSVEAIQQLGHAWSEAGQKSGIQKDALADIPKAIGDIKGLIPTVTGLAKATAPVVGGILSGLGQDEKSKGFETFISNIKSQIAPASKAIQGFGIALGSVMSNLATPKNMAAGDRLLTSISGLVKTSGPGAVSGLDKVAGGISAISNALSKAQSAKSGGKESSLNMLVGGAEGIGRFLGAVGGGLQRLTHDTLGSGPVKSINDSVTTWFAKHTGMYVPGQGVPDPRLGGAAGLSMQKAMEQWQKGAGSAKNLSASNLGLGGKSMFAGASKDAGAAGTQAGKAFADHAASGAKGGKASDAAKTTFSGSEKDAATAGTDTGKQYTSAVTKSMTAGKSQISSATKGSVTDAMKQADSAAKSGAAQLSSDFRGIATQASAALKPLASQVNSSVTSAMTAADASAKSGMTALDTSFQSGVTQAVADLRTLDAQAAAALAPLPAEFRSIGQSAAQGLAAGIQAGTGAAVAAARSMASQVESAARVELQSKSPSKKFRKIGEDSILGLILGLQGGKASVTQAMRDVLGNPFRDGTITSTITKLRKDITSLANSLNPKMANEASGLTRMLDTDNGKLMALAKQRSQLIKEITAADALAKSVQAAAIAGGDLTTIAPLTRAGQQQADLAEGQPGTAQNPYQNIPQGLQAQLTSVRQFGKEITKLKKEGLDKAGIQQLLAAGVQTGGSTAQQMLAGGKAGVEQITKLQDSLGMASKKLGITGANAAYESGSQIGGGLAAGLKSSLKSVDSAMESIARDLVTSLMTALGASGKDIKGALAKLDKELGISPGASGGSSGGGHKVTAPHHVYHVPVSHPVTPAAAGGSMQPSVLHADIVVQLDGQTLARATQTYALQHGKRNPTTYPNLPGR